MAPIGWLQLAAAGQSPLGQPFAHKANKDHDRRHNYNNDDNYNQEKTEPHTTVNKQRALVSIVERERGQKIKKRRPTGSAAISSHFGLAGFFFTFLLLIALSLFSMQLAGAKIHHSKRQTLQTSFAQQQQQQSAALTGRENTNWWNLWWQQYINEAVQPTVRPIVAVSFNGRTINLSDQLEGSADESAFSSNSNSSSNGRDLDTNLVLNTNSAPTFSMIEPIDLERNSENVRLAAIGSSAASANLQRTSSMQPFAAKQMMLAQRKSQQQQAHWQAVKPTIIQPMRDGRSNRQAEVYSLGSDENSLPNDEQQQQLQIGIQMRANMNRPAAEVSSAARAKVGQPISVLDDGIVFEQQHQNLMGDYSEESEPELTGNGMDEQAAKVQNGVDSSSSSMMMGDRKPESQTEVGGGFRQPQTTTATKAATQPTTTAARGQQQTQQQSTTITMPTVSTQQRGNKSTTARPTTSAATATTISETEGPTTSQRKAASSTPAPSTTTSTKPLTTSSETEPQETPISLDGGQQQATTKTKTKTKTTTPSGRVELENGRPATGSRAQATTTSARLPTTRQPSSLSSSAVTTAATQTTRGSQATSAGTAVGSSSTTPAAPPSASQGGQISEEVSSPSPMATSDRPEASAGSSRMMVSDGEQTGGGASSSTPSLPSTTSAASSPSSTSAPSTSSATSQQSLESTTTTTPSGADSTDDSGSDDADDESEGAGSGPQLNAAGESAADSSEGDEESGEDEETTTTQSPSSSLAPSTTTTTTTTTPSVAIEGGSTRASATSTTTKQPSLTTIDIERLPKGPAMGQPMNLGKGSGQATSEAPSSASGSTMTMTTTMSPSPTTTTTTSPVSVEDITRIKPVGSREQQQPQGNLVMMSLDEMGKTTAIIDGETAITVPMDTLMRIMMNQVGDGSTQTPEELNRMQTLPGRAATTPTTQAPTTTTFASSSRGSTERPEIGSSSTMSTFAPASKQTVADQEGRNAVQTTKKRLQPPPTTRLPSSKQQAQQQAETANFVEPSQTMMQNESPKQAFMVSLRPIDDGEAANGREPKIEMLNLDLMPIQRIMMQQQKKEQQRPATAPSTTSTETRQQQMQMQVQPDVVEPGMRLRPPIGVKTMMQQPQQQQQQQQGRQPVLPVTSSSQPPSSVFMIMVNGQVQQQQNELGTQSKRPAKGSAMMVQDVMTSAKPRGSQQTMQTTATLPTRSWQPVQGSTSPQSMRTTQVVPFTTSSQQQQTTFAVTQAPQVFMSSSGRPSSSSSQSSPEIMGDVEQIGGKQGKDGSFPASWRPLAAQSTQPATGSSSTPTTTTTAAAATTTTTAAASAVTTTTTTTSKPTSLSSPGDVVSQQTAAAAATTTSSSKAREQEQEEEQALKTTQPSPAQQTTTSARQQQTPSEPTGSNQVQFERIKQANAFGGEKRPQQQQQGVFSPTKTSLLNKAKPFNLTSSFIPLKLRNDFSGNKSAIRQQQFSGGVGESSASATRQQPQQKLANLVSGSPTKSSRGGEQTQMTAIRQFGGANRMSALANQPVPFGRPVAMTMQTAGRRVELPTFEYGPSIAVRRPDEPLASGQVPNCTLTGKNFCVLTKDYPMNEVRQAVERSFRSVRIMYEELQTVSDQELHKDDYANATSNQAATGKFACQTQVEMMRPGWAKDEITREWMLVVNTDVFPQKVRTESCAQPNTPCEFIAPFYDSTCQQRYSLHRMIAIDPHDPSRSPQVAVFKFPAGCVCRVHPIRKTTTTSAATMTPTTSLATSTSAPTTVISSATSISIRRRR